MKLTREGDKRTWEGEKRWLETTLKKRKKRKKNLKRENVIFQNLILEKNS